MDTGAATVSSGPRQFPCQQCGANLVFQPGTTHLVCQYCGAANDIPALPVVVQELDFHAHATRLLADETLQEVLAVRCVACGAETDLSHGATAGRCPFCGSAVVATGVSKKQIKPQSLLPFRIAHQQAGESFRTWVKSLWFAPSDLVKLAERSRIDGAYVPAWTYDANTVSDYRGERGDHYWDTETYTSFENGKHVTRTRQVQKTRWHSASGRVFNRFDDVLVLASRSLPPQHAAALEPWDLKELVPYRDEYLSGFAAESYQVTLEQGFEQAKGIMDGLIRQNIRRDIGGDEQRIHWVQTQHNDVTFKHVLLPVWISAYRYREKVFRFLVNARTGEVQGERPYSAIKIALLVMLIVLVVAVIAFFVAGR